MVETNVMESAYAQRQSLLGPTTSTTGGGMLGQNQKFPMSTGSFSGPTGTTMNAPIGVGSAPIGATSGGGLLGQPLPTQQANATTAATTTEFIGVQQQQQQQQISATNIIQEKPVLDRVEKVLHKEVIQKPRIQEQLKQDIIEIHEKPIEKRIIHPVQEVRIQDQGTFEVQGKEVAEMERERILFQMREQDRLRRVEVDQRQDVRVINEVPIQSQSREMRKEIIEKPIVTEIHQQPIREIHEQALHRTVYQAPLISVVRDQKIYESVSSQVPLNYDQRAFATVQPVIGGGVQQQLPLQQQQQFPLQQSQMFGGSSYPQQQLPLQQPLSSQYGSGYSSGIGQQAPLGSTLGTSGSFIGGGSSTLPLQQQQGTFPIGQQQPLWQQQQQLPLQQQSGISQQYSQPQSFSGYGGSTMGSDLSRSSSGFGSGMSSSNIIPSSSSSMQQGYLPQSQQLPLPQQTQPTSLLGSQQSFSGQQQYGYGGGGGSNLPMNQPYSSSSGFSSSGNQQPWQQTSGGNWNQSFPQQQQQQLPMQQQGSSLQQGLNTINSTLNTFNQSGLSSSGMSSGLPSSSGMSSGLGAQQGSSTMSSSNLGSSLSKMI